jgi:endonuclease YncB( thermonuclease family)
VRSAVSTGAVTVCLVLMGCTAGSLLTSDLSTLPMEPGLTDGFYVVSRVIDGDTIELHNVGTLRFRSFNAPELDKPGGYELKARLAAMVEGKAVYVRFARRKKDGIPIRGHYGRLLGDIFIDEGTIMSGNVLLAAARQSSEEK